MASRNSNPLSENTSVLFVTFSRWVNGKRTPTNGSLDPMRDYLVPRIKRLVILDQPHPGSDRVMPVIELYNNHSVTFTQFNSSWYLYILKPLLNMFNVSSTQLIFKIRDFLSVIDWSLRDSTIYDYCICLESINTLAAIMLRKMGRVKKVVYYVSDYSPNRYNVKLVNSIYLALDRFCATHADFIWDVSPAMQKARIEEAGLDPKRSAPAIHVPNGLKPEQIKTAPLSADNRHSLIYMGTVGADNGPDIAIKALALVRQKFKDSKLHIIGGSAKDRIWLEILVKKLKLEKAVTFHGFVQDGVKMSEIIRSCAIGLAPYRYTLGSIRLYADAGKIRAYCASGLPTVSSQVPPLGREVESKGAAVVTQDNPKSFADSIVRIFQDPKLYAKLRRNAIMFGRNNTWENSFTAAFLKVKSGKV
jgi:glycosyltransferase involved in cell wall biosynthesis